MNLIYIFKIKIITLNTCGEKTKIYSPEEISGQNPEISCIENNQLLKFNDSSIKYFIYDDNIYFKAKDVTIILGYEDTNQTIRKNVNPNDKIILGDFFK